MCSELINEVIKGWDTWLESLSLSDTFNNDVGLWVNLKWVSWKHFPMIKYALWECSSWSSGSKGLGETEWLSYWEEASHVYKWGTGNWLLTFNWSSSLGHGLIDGTNNIIWSLNFYQEDWLLKFWLSSKFASINNSSGSWDDLTTTSVDSISMEGYIMNVESVTSHVLITQSTFFGCPLESSFNWIFDFIKELHTLGNINEHVSTIGVWTEAPDLQSISFVPFEFFREIFGSSLWMSLWSQSSVFN